MNENLNALQKLALKKITAKNYKYFGLTGGGGVGKTYLLKHLPYYWKVAYTAPTNKAVSVLIKSGLPEEHCYTIDSFLGLKTNELNGKATKDKSGLSKAARYDVVVVDEASMISSEMLEYIRSAAESFFNMVIIFMGDVYQLPPVGEQSSPAFNIIDDGVHLLEQMRQSANDHPLTGLLDDLRRSVDSGVRLDFSGYNAQIVDTESGNKVGIVVTNNQTRFNGWILRAFDDVRGFDNSVIAYTNYRVDEYNGLIHNDNSCAYRVGETLIVQKPVKLTAMINLSGRPKEIQYKIGDEIRIKAIEEKTVTVELGTEIKTIKCLIITDEANGDKLLCPENRNEFNQWFDARAQSMKHPNQKNKYSWPMLYAIRDQFANVRLGYAGTTHKSQGSTYDNVFIDIPNIQSMREPQKIINQCLYTAISRAKYTAVLLTN